MASRARRSYSPRTRFSRFGQTVMSFIRMLYAWWHSATLGTWFTTWFSGVPIGTDKFGNRYYERKDGSRRWVIYAGTVEASRVPPDWHGWLHHTFKDPPTTAPFKEKAWEKDHVPNLTGTPEAYRPDGSLLKTGERPRATGDYQAWKPD